MWTRELPRNKCAMRRRVRTHVPQQFPDGKLPGARSVLLRHLHRIVLPRHLLVRLATYQCNLLGDLVTESGKDTTEGGGARRRQPPGAQCLPHRVPSYLGLNFWRPHLDSVFAGCPATPSPRFGDSSLGPTSGNSGTVSTLS